MSKINIYCLSLFKSDYKRIIKNNYIPVGLGNANFTSNWLTDDIGKNISYKNPYYGEYTFHYNIWKNDSILKEHTGWIGFCTYRRFWLQNKISIEDNSLNKDILKKIPNEWKNYDSILVQPIKTNKTKLSKVFKHGKKIFIKNPLLFFDKNKITIKVHFDMYHGYGNLDKAINVMDKKHREKFRNFVNNKIEFNPYNMFICKNKQILFEYYKTIFPWLKNCESVFGFDLGEKYGKKRIYGFLAERFLSYWFSTYTKALNWPIIFKDKTLRN